jgi:hypothetical protein
MLIQSGMSTKRFAIICVIILFLAGLAALAATGRLHWLVASGAAILPFLRRLPVLLRMLPFASFLSRYFRSGQHPFMGSGRSQAKPGQRSSIQTRFIAMSLDREVLEGRFQGYALSALTQTELTELLNECRADNDSLQVLEAWLDRTHENWREEMSQSSEQQSNGHSSGRMTEQEALEILDLEAGADREEIINAHRRLMQKVHPDRGGSTYLAAKLNEAKDTLLG